MNKLHTFLVVAESNSMREAGERLLRSSSAISQSITTLERELDVKLFDRIGIRLRLTHRGCLLLEELKENESRLTGVLQKIRANDTTISGIVTLGMPPGYPAESLSRPIGTTLRDHPDIQLRFRFKNHADLALGLKEGSIQLALSLQSLSRKESTIRSKRIRKEQLILVIPQNLRHYATGELKKFPVIDYFQKPLMIEGWLKHHRLRRAQPHVRIYGAHVDHVVQLTLEGLGCAIVPYHMAKKYVARGELIEHGLDHVKPWRSDVWINSWTSEKKMDDATQKIYCSLV